MKRKCTDIRIRSYGTNYLGMPNPGYLDLTIQENYVEYRYISMVPMDDFNLHNPTIKERLTKKVETSNQRLDYQFELDGFVLYLYYRKDLPME